MQSRFNLRNTFLTGFLILMELLGLLVIFVGFVKADTPLTEMIGVNSDPNVIIDADHAFSPTISSQTKVSVVSTSNCQEDTTISKPQKNDYTFGPPTDSQKSMTVVMKYTNVGLDNNGNAIDATVTVTTTNVTNWVEIYEIGHVRISSTVAPKNMSAQVQINFTNNGQPAKVSGHLSFSNINNLKNLMLPLRTTNDPNTTTGIKNISQIYCAPATSSTGGDVTHLVYSKDEKNIIISDGIPNDKVKNTSKCIMFTAIFDSVSSLSYSFAGTNNSNYKTFDTGFTMGSIVDVAIPPITKKGIDERPDDKKQAGKQTALKAKSAFQIVPKAKFWQIPDLKKSITQRKFQETLQQKQIAAPDIKIADTTKQEDPFKIRPLYYLQQNLPQKSASYLTIYQIKDPLNDTWTLDPDGTNEVNVKITDEQGNNRASDFSVSYDSSRDTQTKNTLTINATTNALGKTDFYGHVYTFVISGSFAKDSEGRLVTKDNINNPDSSYTGYTEKIPNTAQIKYTKASSDTDTEYTTNTAYAYIAYPSERPDISVDSNTGIDLDNKTITGTIKDNLVHGQDSLYWDLTINYTNSSGVSKSTSLNLNNPSDSQHQNRVYKNDSTSSDSGVNFTAKLPDDIKMPNTQDEKDDYSKFTITATNRYGILGHHDYNLPWWTLDKDGLLTIYPHTIAPTGSVYESSWPWNSQRNNVKSIKILKSAPSTDNGSGVKVEGSLKYMFSTMKNLTSIEGLDNLQPVSKVSNQTLDFSYLFSGDSNLEKLDLSGLDMSNATWVSGIFSGDNMLNKLTLSNKNKLLIKNSLDSEKPMLRSGSWQKFGQTGTEDDPTGDVFTTEKLLDLYSSDKYATAPNETYVWTDPDSPWWEVTNGVLKIHKHTIHRKPTKASDWPWSSYASEITEVDIDGDGVVKAQGSLAYMFSGLSNLTTIKGLSNLQTSNITSVAHLFDGCTNLSAIQGLDKFNTSSVTSMSYLFYECESLKELDLPDKFVTQSVTDISYMFYGCTNLSAIQGLDKFDTSSVTSMNSLFTGCHTLKELDLPDKFVTQSVTDISHMFDGCIALKDIIGLDKFDTSKVTDMSYMFRWDGALKSLNLQNFDMSNVTDTTAMFANNNNLSELSLGKKTQFKGDPGLCEATVSAPPYKYGDVHSKNWQAVGSGTGGTVSDPTGAVLSKQELIDRYTNDSSSFNPIKETYVWDKTWWTFDKDSGLLTIYPHDINVVPNNDFDKVKADTWPWDSQRDDVTSIQIIGNSDSSLGDNVQVEGSLKYMFSGMSKLTNVQGLNYLHPNPLLNSKLNNQKALDFSYLFAEDAEDSKLEKLDLSGLDMSNATWVTNMFSGDNSLQKLTLSNKNRLQTSTPQKSNAALPSPNNENYTKNWQAKSSENEEDHYPTGKVYPAKDLENLYGDTNAPKGPTTYVWQPTGNLMFTQVPASLNYKVIRLPEFFTNSIKSSGNSSQTIKIQDSRAFRTGLKKSWNVQLTLIAKDLKGAQLHFSDDKTEYTGSGPYLIPAGNFTQKQDKYSWSTNDDGIQLDLQNLNYKNVENKSYNLEIDYNLTNSVN
ncbi:BspA family leucine-rich repeat surface protein [Bombilactobacillus mellis]|uniref:BspA family leucine-rich repeat surface protein n=1 Tax=Bombilactobacillus mellis TaxID=1218508 RepID=UPI0022466993|nr:BspA family leucine-rich repeat surface protein [Bombilactobacillus mellis]MCX0279166.1 BspA family leucine-rich repeat surface protein [Bombilactobacillus mellis]